MHSLMSCVSPLETWLVFERRHISLSSTWKFGVHCGQELPRTSGVALLCAYETVAAPPREYPSAQVGAMETDT
jgi:hypothetical protein